MAVKYELRDTLTYTIERLNHSIYELQSRVSECESKIARLNNQVYGIHPEQNSELNELAMDFKDLKCQIIEEISELRADLDAWVVKSNEKSDLEILEQNGRNELKYIDLDDDEKNDYWYWNGETWT